MLIAPITPNSDHLWVVVISSSCRCAGGQGTRTLLHPRVILGREQRAEPIPNPNPLQRKLVWVPVCWVSHTPRWTGDGCGDLGSYGNSRKETTECPCSSTESVKDRDMSLCTGQVWSRTLWSNVLFSKQDILTPKFCHLCGYYLLLYSLPDSWIALNWILSP